MGQVPGLSEFSESWAKSFMRAHGFCVRAETTDRVVKVSEVLAEGNEFFANMNAVREGELNVFPELVFNMDEFFTKLEDNYHWTWERIPVGGKKIFSASTTSLDSRASPFCR